MDEGKRLSHCRHCLGDACGGGCLYPDGQCIHGWNGKRPRQVTWQAVLDRLWWRRLLWGDSPRRRRGPGDSPPLFPGITKRDRS